MAPSPRLGQDAVDQTQHLLNRRPTASSAGLSLRVALADPPA
jgi:hypothetical protein